MSDRQRRGHTTRERKAMSVSKRVKTTPTWTGKKDGPRDRKKRSSQRTETNFSLTPKPSLKKRHIEI
jgi:hypothetical protein